MVPSATGAEQTVREFVERVMDEEYADAADMLTEGGRENVVESAPESFREDDPDAESVLEQYWWGLYGQYGDFQSVDEVAVDGDEVAADLSFEHGSERATVTVDGSGVADLSFSPAYEEPAYADRDAFDEYDVPVDAGDVTLDGVLAVPDATDPVPGVVLVHGWGLHDPDGTAGASKILKDLAWGLASEGVAVLRYEKRPNVCDLGPEEHDMDTLAVDDAVAALETLESAEEVDTSGVFVAGHSQGGMCAPRIAERHGGVAGVVVLDGPAGTVPDPEDVDVMRYRMEPDGELSEEQEAALEAEREALERIANGDVEADETLLGVSGTYWESRRELDPAGTASDLGAPVFAAGTERVDSDLQAPLADQRRESFADWEAVDVADGSRFEYYRDVGHYFQEGPVPVKMEHLEFGGNVADYVVADLVEWVHDVAGD